MIRTVSMRRMSNGRREFFKHFESLDKDTKKLINWFGVIKYQMLNEPEIKGSGKIFKE